MKREIVVTLMGDLKVLEKVWTPPPGVEVNHQLNELQLVFAAEYFEEFNLLETAVRKIQPAHSIEIVPFFRAFDFTRDDLENSVLLWMRVVATPGLEVSGQPPVREERCPECGSAVYHLQEVSHLELYADHLPQDMLIAAVNLKLFHHDLIKQFQAQGLIDSLQTLPAQIKLEKEKLINVYAWGFSSKNLGIPTGGIRVAKPCPACGTPQVIENRAFLTTFPHGNWDGAHFCTSTFYGPDFMFVSQAVYQLITTLPEDKRGKVFFEPVILE